jgi:hypothetical protein
MRRDYDSVLESAENFLRVEIGSSIVKSLIPARVGGRWLFECQCQICSKVSLIRVSDIEKELYKGCLLCRPKKRKDNAVKRHPLYPTWSNIKARTLKKSNHNYHLYGGRGIKMEESWLQDFWKFVKDIEGTLGVKPSLSYSLDRIDNNIGYFVHNLRWATTKEQAQNRRGSPPRRRFVDFEGKKIGLRELSELLMVPLNLVVSSYINQGWRNSNQFTTLQESV